MMQQINLKGEIQMREIKHNSRCEDAHPKGRCLCHCGGALHGKNNGGNEYDRTVTERLGGEVEQTIKELNGKTFTCTCKRKHTIRSWLGYPHDGGLTDGDGGKWWIYVECTKCKYDWSWHKIPVLIEREELNKDKKVA